MADAEIQGILTRELKDPVSFGGQRSILPLFNKSNDMNCRLVFRVGRFFLLQTKLET